MATKRKTTMAVADDILLRLPRLEPTKIVANVAGDVEGCWQSRVTIQELVRTDHNQ
jgi:hypothetical protein